MRWRDFLILVALVVMTWAVFVHVCHFEFVDLDDGVYVFENQHVLSGLTWDNVRWSYSGVATALTGNWHPLTWLSLMLDAQIFGNDAGGYHLTSLLYHTANVLLVFVVLKQMTGAVWKSAFVAALFAVHPMHVESVVWISERKDVLSTFFGLISLWAYTCYARQPAVGSYLVALVAFVLSLLSKQMLVTMPCLLLLLDYWPLRRVRWIPSTDEKTACTDRSLDRDLATENGRPSFPTRSWRRLLWEKSPFFVVTAVFCVVALVGQQQGKALISLEQFSPGQRASNGLVVYVIYIVKTVLPHNLACFYPHPKSVPLLEVAGSIAVLIVVTFVAFVQARPRPYLLVGWLWYLGMLVPVIGLVKIGLPRMADRFTYVPGIGLFIAVTWLVPTLVPSGLWRQRILPCFAAVILLAFAAAARVQTTYWRNSITMFEHAAAVTELNQLAHYNLAHIRYEEGRFDQAIDHFQEVLRIHPADPAAHNGLGLALTKIDKLDEALHHFGESIRFEPLNADVHNNMGLALFMLNRPDEAASRFRLAQSIDPKNAMAYYNLGNVLEAQQLYEEAIREFQKALSIDPKNARIHNNLGFVLYVQERYDESIQSFQESLSIDPKDALAHYNLAKLLLQRGERKLAIRHFQDAVQLDPNLEDAQKRLQRALEE